MTAMSPAAQQFDPDHWAVGFLAGLPTAPFSLPCGPPSLSFAAGGPFLSLPRFDGFRPFARRGPFVKVLAAPMVTLKARLPSSPPAPVVLKRPPGLCAAPPGPASVNRGGAFLNIVSKQLQGSEGKSRRVTGQVTERTQSNTGNETKWCNNPVKPNAGGPAGELVAGELETISASMTGN
jgi:hypothetical protein